MELRHLRYFIAVAEEGSLTLAGERWLHTAQPSVSRREVGVSLVRTAVRRTANSSLVSAGWRRSHGIKKSGRLHLPVLL
jgi:hypothetical protein